MKIRFIILDEIKEKFNYFFSYLKQTKLSKYLEKIEIVKKSKEESKGSDIIKILMPISFSIITFLVMGTVLNDVTDSARQENVSESTLQVLTTTQSFIPLIGQMILIVLVILMIVGITSGSLRGLEK